MERSPVAAAADVGSTSVHLLVASVAADRLEALVDESVFLGLGERVDSRAYLGSALIETLAGAIASYAERAAAHGATQIAIVGTEPLRRAADAATAVHAAAVRSGSALHVLTQREEAMLTLLGVTEGWPAGRRTVVVDIGGGSTEFVVATAAEPASIAGVGLGAARLTRQFVRHDPPTPAEMADLGRAAHDLLAAAPDAAEGDLVLVGGTASNLLRILTPSAPGGGLTPDRVAEALTTVARSAAAEVAARFGIRVERARLMPAGATIVAALLERYGSAGARVSEAGIREGTIRALARAGAGWRDALPELARGWR